MEQMILLEGRTEPGDNSDVKIASCFQATQSNMNKLTVEKDQNFMILS